MNTKQKTSAALRKSVTKTLCQGKRLWKSLQDAGLYDGILAMFAYRTDDRTGHIVPNAAVSHRWQELESIIRASDGNKLICGAWDRILHAIKDDPDAKREGQIARNRRMRDDLKPTFMAAINYGLRKHCLGIVLSNLGIIDERRRHLYWGLEDLLETVPDELIDKVNEFTCEIRSVLLPSRNIRGQRERAYQQPSRDAMERRYAMIPGPAFLALLGIEHVVSDHEYEQLEKLIEAYNNPRWKAIEGIRYGNLKQADRSNPIVKLLADRQAELIRNRTINASRQKLFLPRRIVTPSRNRHTPAR